VRKRLPLEMLIDDAVADARNENRDGRHTTTSRCWVGREAAAFSGKVVQDVGRRRRREAWDGWTCRQN
jgi:hypothetical protein